MALSALGALVAVFAVASATGSAIEDLGGHGTWQSALSAVLEAALVLGLSVWLLDLFRRRYNHQGWRARQLSRAAYGAFLVHQVILVALVLATRRMAWPPGLDFLVASTLGVAVSFGIAMLLVRILGCPGSRDGSVGKPRPAGRGVPHTPAEGETKEPLWRTIRNRAGSARARGRAGSSSAGFPTPGSTSRPAAERAWPWTPRTCAHPSCAPVPASAY